MPLPSLSLYFLEHSMSGCTKLVVAKPETTSGPPRAVKSCIFLGPQLSLRDRKRQELYVCKRLWGRAVERNAASPGQHLGGREQALGGLQVPFQANSSRKPTHPARPKSSPNYPCSNSSCHPFCLIFFSLWPPCLTPPHASVGTSANFSTYLLGIYYMVSQGKPHLTSSLGQGALLCSHPHLASLMKVPILYNELLIT